MQGEKRGESEGENCRVANKVGSGGVGRVLWPHDMMKGVTSRLRSQGNNQLHLSEHTGGRATVRGLALLPLALQHQGALGTREGQG